jgi:hypothetical protein
MNNEKLDLPTDVLIRENTAIESYQISHQLVRLHQPFWFLFFLSFSLLGSLNMV